MDTLKKFLKDSGTTQAEFARSLEVSQPTVSDWINGHVYPTIENLKAISKQTGIALSILVRDFDKDVA